MQRSTELDVVKEKNWQTVYTQVKLNVKIGRNIKRKLQKYVCIMLQTKLATKNYKFENRNLVLCFDYSKRYWTVCCTLRLRTLIDFEIFERCFKTVYKTVAIVDVASLRKIWSFGVRIIPYEQFKNSFSVYEPYLLLAVLFRATSIKD